MTGIIVFITALILGSVLLPIGFIWGVGEAFYKRGYKKGIKRVDNYFFNVALSIDQLGNTTCKELLNDTLITNNSEHKFGNPDETISGVLGKNQLKGTLTKTGKYLNYVLDLIEEDHSIKAIEEDEV